MSTEFDHRFQPHVVRPLKTAASRSLILKVEDKFDSGAYADIFQPAKGDLVYKLFVSGQHPTNVSQNLTHPEHDIGRQKTFMSECEAYRRAARHPLLRNHIARFFGSQRVSNVTDMGSDVSCGYLLDCCYAMEFIDRTPIKLAHLKNNLPRHIDQVLEVFKMAGIHHVIDASVFSPDDPAGFRLVDFAIEEFPPCGG